MRRFFRIWVEKHFPLVCPLGNYTESRLKYLADSLRHWTIEKSDVSLADNLAMELSPSGRSLIYIKNNRGQRMDPWETPALIGSQLYSWPFNTILSNLLER